MGRRAARADRDRFLDPALAAASIPLLRVKASANYEPQALASMLARLKSKPAANPKQPAAPNSAEAQSSIH